MLCPLLSLVARSSVLPVALPLFSASLPAAEKTWMIIPLGIGAAVVGEALMVLGYFLFETALYGVAGGAASLIGNALQGTFGVVCSVLLVSILYRLKAVRGFCSPLMCPPHLKKEA